MKAIITNESKEQEIDTLSALNYIANLKINDTFQVKDNMGAKKMIPVIKQALTRLEELEKKHTPMKPYWEHAYICNDCSNDYVEKSDNYCTNCGQALDWTGDNKPLQNMESGE
jgi:hypothetical protein